MIIRHLLLFPLAALALQGCETPDRASRMDAFSGYEAAAAHDPANEARDASYAARDERIGHQLVEQALQALADGDLEKASHRANAALKFDITNPRLQFLNAYVYQQMGLSGDTSKYQLAEQGYLQTLKFDPGNTRVQHQLGAVYMAQRKYALAKGYFAAVALDNADDPAALYDLATASYYARDPLTAEAVLRELAATSPAVADRPEFAQALSIATAAVNDREAADALLARYSETLAGANSLDFVKRRLRNWRDFYEYDANNLLTYASLTNVAEEVDELDEPGDAEDLGEFDELDDVNEVGEVDGTDETPASTDMVVVEVVLIGTQEDARRSRGVNLLEGLQLQFGDTLENVPGVSFGETRINDALNSGLAENTQTITNFINIPAIRYSLNIANALDSYGEILAKPSLVALSGETSEFFSGTEVLAAAVSGGDGDSVSVEKEVGVKLAVTPTILGSGKVRLHVAAERTFLTDPSTSVLFEFRLDTTKTNINSTVTMDFGETLVIGGLTEKETTSSTDGVPIIRDIPGINLFFSQEASRVFERSILILITPRRPQFTSHTAGAGGEARENTSSVERDVERFQQRHREWFAPRDGFMRQVNHGAFPAFTEEFHANDMPRTGLTRRRGTAGSVDDLKRYLLAGDL
ncbi:MAG: hypothetical protein ABJL17_05580 [Parvibaculum sp.]|uniref:hypothetical protein n=1 Tax=Parvibaculum sp. TaxID=2024848 RepID=UPI0032634172